MAEHWDVYQNVNQLRFHKELLQCGVCEILLSPPIYLDAHSGNICKKCKTENNIDNACRNEPLEAALSKTLFPCKYVTNGCHELFTKDNLFKHQCFCHYAPIKCPKCKKDGFATVDDIIEHCEDDHAMEQVVIANPQGPAQGPISLQLKEFESDNGATISLFKIQLNQNIFVIKTSQLQWEELHVVICCPTGFKIDDQVIIKVQETYQEIRTFAKINECWNMLHSTDDNHISKVHLTEKVNNLKIELIFNNNMKLNEIKEAANFRKDIECPICFNFLLGEIFKCTNGHNICGSCKVLIDTCPVCRENMNNTHDVRLENIMPQVRLNCYNITYGCLVIADLKFLKEHEKNCTFNQFACHMDECTYEHTQLNLINHYNKTHRMQINGVKLEANMHEKISVGIVYMKTIFFLESRTDNHAYVWKLKLLNSAHYSSRFVYEIELFDSNESLVLCLANSCSKKVSLAVDVLRKLCENDKFTFKCSIRKICF